MPLQSARTRDPDKFPAAQLFLLAIVRLAEPIALTSIFPYAWALVKKFEVGSEKDASFYAGLLISAFALTEAGSGMFWGTLSDRIGRKPVLIAGCLGTALSLVLVGFSCNIWVALAGRAIGGLLNGNVGCIQTMVGELVTRPEHERKYFHLNIYTGLISLALAFSIMPFVWAVGTVIGPAIGGNFADPAQNFPSTFSEDGLFGQFPYLLPNLICAGLLLISIIAAHFLLEETHPDKQPRNLLPMSIYSTEITPFNVRANTIKTPAADLRAGTYGTFVISEASSQRSTPIKTVSNSQIFTKRVTALLIALSLLTYHSMTYDHLLPIFFEDRRHFHLECSDWPCVERLQLFHIPGGLGLSVKQVGVIMSVQGLVALLIQGVIFPVSAAKVSIHRLFVIASVLQPITYLIMPYLTLLPSSSLYYGIYAALFVRNLLSILAYPVLLILIKDATPNPAVLGKINGLAACAGAACRTIAPPISGLLYTLGSQIQFTGLAWYGSACVAAVGSFQCFMIKRQKNGRSDLKSSCQHSSG